jgi:hypothetical protein
MAKYSKEDIAQAWEIIEQYRGAKLKAEVVSVSRTGMSRRLRFYAACLDRNGKPNIVDITWLLARLGNYGMNDSGLRVDGCGMDMCFSVISNFNYLAAMHFTGKTIAELLKTKECGEHIYDDYFFDANRL